MDRMRLGKSKKRPMAMQKWVEAVVAPPRKRQKKQRRSLPPPTLPTGGPWGGSPQACWRGASPLLRPARPRARRLMLVHHAMLWEEQMRGQRVPTKWIRGQHHFLGNHRAHDTRLHSCVVGSRAPSAALPAPDTGRLAARQWCGARPSRACSRAGKFASTLCRSRSLSLRRSPRRCRGGSFCIGVSPLPHACNQLPCTPRCRPTPS